MPNNAAKSTAKAVRFALPAEHTPRRHDSPLSRNQELPHRRPNLTSATNPRKPSNSRQELELASTRAVHGSEKSSPVARRQESPATGKRRPDLPGNRKDPTINRKPRANPSTLPAYPPKRPDKRPAPPTTPAPRRKPPLPSSVPGRKSSPAQKEPEQVRVKFHRGSRRTDVKIAGGSGLPPLVVKFR